MDELRGKKLEEMLLSYQQLAMNSLRGPASTWRDIHKPTVNTTNGHSHSFGTLAGNQMSKLLAVAPPRKIGTELPFDYKLSTQPNFPAIPPTPSYFLQPDVETETGKLIYCELEDAHIAGFVIGGEERLCLPPILHTVLKEIDLVVINEACDALLIHCSRCTSHQLRLLKEDKILPPHIASAGLIRKTDAERLCTLLLHNFKLAPVTDPDHRIYPQINKTCLPVYHECFGEGHGFLHTELYSNPYSRCISCADCEKLFSPERFVTHTHFNQENKICHWGFNRRNWRNYLLLSDDEICDEELKELQYAFKSVLDKFQNVSKKRKLVATEGCVEIPRQVPPLSASYTVTVSPANNSPSIKRRCNRPPMKAYQYVKGRPSVENPDAVVPHSEKHLYHKHYVPNVCIKANSPSSSSSAASPQDDLALDLRSPSMRERHTSVCSTQSAETPPGANEETPDHAGVKDTSTEGAGQTADEIVDVESSDDCPVIAQPAALPVENEETKGIDGETQTDHSDSQQCLDKLDSLFLEILNSSNMSEENKREKTASQQALLSQLKLLLV